METDNQTPYVVAAMPQIGPNEKPVLTIAVKGTFDIRPGETSPASTEQMPVGFGDELYDPVSGGSVKFESDLAPFKPRADVALVGHAHARGGHAVTALDVSLQVGSLKKKLRVTGNRRWKWLGRMLPVTATAPEPFTRMPLVYENAFGGIDAEGGGYCAENLAGCGFVARKKKQAIDGVRLPNIEEPGQLIRSWKDRPKPAGFGFYGKSWAPRLQYMGTYDDNWRKNRAPGPPADFRFDYYNAAHPDLQIGGYLSGDESVELVNLSPEGYLRFMLPGTTLQCTAAKSFDLVDFAETAMPDLAATPQKPQFAETVPLNLDTLCLIPDEKKFYLVWRGICPVSDLTALEVKKITVSEGSASR